MRFKRTLVGFLTIAISAVTLTASPIEASSLGEVRNIVESRYYKEVGEDILNRDTIGGIVEGLEDPNTSYMTREQYESFINSIERKFYGVGFYFEVIDRGALINSVISNSPAEKSGLVEGDILISVDGKSVKGLTSEEIATLIRGEDGTKVVLGIIRGESRLDIIATRGVINIEYVSSGDYEPNSGYIRVASFGSETASKFGEMLSKQNSENIVLDLRNNGGGFTSSAIDMLGYMLPGKDVIRLKSRTKSETYSAPEHQDYTEKPIVLLINEYSASASEIVAGALKDHERALIIGSKTYGKGTAQSLFNLSDGSILKLTTMEFLSPLGNRIHNIGISPDIEISDENIMKVVDILKSPSDMNNSIQIKGESYPVNLKLARSREYWGAYREFLIGIGLEDIWKDFYPDYKLVGNLSDLPLDKTYTIKFNMNIDKKSINSDTIDILNSANGIEVELEFMEGSKENEVKVKPVRPLEDDSKYWLKINPGVKSSNGKDMKTGGLALIDT